jgi:thiol-disulfide isomerase/thioredoxin
MITTTLTNQGELFSEISNRGPVLIVFLRHFGCTFCRETLVELSKVKREAKEKGVQIVLVHMSKVRYADEVLKIYNLDDVVHISDPEQELYREYGLNRAKWWKFLLPNVLFRGMIAGLFKGHLIGKPVADPYQMPGVFLLKENTVVTSFVHRFASDRPKYENLLNC